MDTSIEDALAWRVRDCVVADLALTSGGQLGPEQRQVVRDQLLMLLQAGYMKSTSAAATAVEVRAR